MFNVPPETVRVPLLVKGVLFKVQPTVRSPEDTTSVPPELMVKFLETLFAELTVTVCVEAIITLSVHVGTCPPLHVATEFQSPDVADVRAVVDIVILELFVLEQVPFVERTR